MRASALPVLYLVFASAGFVTAAALPGMPPVPDSRNIYSETRSFSPAVKGFPDRIYVPNSGSGTVDVIDPHTYKVIDHFTVGRQPQHVTPSWDLRSLWVLNDLSDSLTRIDPSTGKKGDTVRVKDPYNMYYTPDGKFAIVVAERVSRLDFRDATTFALVESLSVPCRGVDHIDFSADGQFLIASCEFSGSIVKVDVAHRTVVGTLALGGAPTKPMAMTASMSRHMTALDKRRAYDLRHSPTGSMPQDVKTSPDGRIYYVADMYANGVYMIDAVKFTSLGFIPTGEGAHGLYPSRDAKLLYCSNRDEGTISVISFATHKVVQTWTIPNGTPDMGGVSADGKVLWLSGRYSKEVYALDTQSGKLLARIPVGKGPHGLCVYPQPGRYSLGHTGILR